MSTLRFLTLCWCSVLVISAPVRAQSGAKEDLNHSIESMVGAFFEMSVARIDQMNEDEFASAFRCPGHGDLRKDQFGGLSPREEVKNSLRTLEVRVLKPTAKAIKGQGTMVLQTYDSPVLLINRDLFKKLDDEGRADRALTTVVFQLACSGKNPRGLTEHHVEHLMELLQAI